MKSQLQVWLPCNTQSVLAFPRICNCGSVQAFVAETHSYRSLGRAMENQHVLPRARITYSEHVDLAMTDKIGLMFPVLTI